MQEEVEGVVNSAAPVGAGIRLNIGSIVSMEVEGKYHINMGDFQDYASINYGFNFNFGKGKDEKNPGSSTSGKNRDRDEDGVWMKKMLVLIWLDQLLSLAVRIRMVMV